PHPGVELEVLGMGAPNAGRIEVIGYAELLEDQRPAVEANRYPAFVAPLFVHDFARDRRLVPDMDSDHGRIEGGTEVVQVGDGHVAPTRLYESLEQTTALESLGQVAVTGSVLARPAVFLPKQVSLRSQAQRELLGKRGDPESIDLVAQCLPDRPLGGVTRHQPHR